MQIQVCSNHGPRGSGGATIGETIFTCVYFKIFLSRTTKPEKFKLILTEACWHSADSSCSNHGPRGSGGSRILRWAMWPMGLLLLLTVEYLGFKTIVPCLCKCMLFTAAFHWYGVVVECFQLLYVQCYGILVKLALFDTYTRHFTRHSLEFVFLAVYFINISAILHMENVLQIVYYMHLTFVHRCEHGESYLTNSLLLSSMC